MNGAPLLLCFGWLAEGGKYGFRLPLRMGISRQPGNGWARERERRCWAAWNALPRSYGLPANRASAKDDGRNGLGGESSLCTIRFLLH